jgi:glycyl-tRNA synthetase beta chain
MAKVLLEIGLEEVPARFMPSALKQLQTLAGDLLKEARISFGSIFTYGTPRRLALVIDDVVEKQADLVKEVKGPAKKAAFDGEGKPTKAILGFAKGQKVAIEDLEVKTLGNVEYMYATVKETGKETISILPIILTKLIASLHFPKPMRWGTETMRFVRPIRWLVALHDDKVIGLEVAGVHSGRVTYGHRFLSKEPIRLASSEEYVSSLEKAYVIVDQNRRRHLIREQISTLAAKEGGQVDKDEKLLEEVTYLVEYPTALCGNFPERYLDLPEEVLITPMKEHQRYFPVWDKNNKLLPKFITIHNGTEEYLDNVTAGNVKVLLARLADAEFFYQEDQKVPLVKKVEYLQKVVFQESLGTVYEKVKRIKQLAVYIAKKLAWEEKEVNLVEIGASIAKADLVTNMVYEFPELQGIMGGYYAEIEGYDPIICQGIREHYQPRFAGDQLPKSAVGIAISLADKLDTIVGCFGVGLIPTGSQDPLGLRRQALGICNTILEHGLRLSLEELIIQAYQLYGNTLKQDDLEKVKSQGLQFFRQRMENILEERGIRYDVTEAVLAAGYDDLADTWLRAKVLQAYEQHPHYKSLVTAFARAANLTKNMEIFEVEEGLFAEDEEEILFEAVKEVTNRVEDLLADSQYVQALDSISMLHKPIDNFFSEVMVMVEDKKTKENRLGILQKVTYLTSKIADLSKLVVK